MKPVPVIQPHHETTRNSLRVVKSGEESWLNIFEKFTTMSIGIPFAP
jgi:hypothetical protein